MADDKREENEEQIIMTLNFDDGENVECEVMGTFDANGKEYIALIPDDGTDDVYIFGYDEEEFEKGGLIEIEDDEEFEIAVKAFDEIMGEEE